MRVCTQGQRKGSHTGKLPARKHQRQTQRKSGFAAGRKTTVYAALKDRKVLAVRMNELVM